MGNDAAAQKENDGDLHHAISTRDENKWQSNVFAGPKPDKLHRKNLEPAAQGKAGLYGDKDDKMDWWKPVSFAGEISQKEKTREVAFKEAPDYERKNKELYGNSLYAPTKKGDGGLMTAGADWKNPQQTYTNKKDKVQAGLIDPYEVDNARKSRKANQMQSNVLTHEDDALREERNLGFDFAPENKMQAAASNASWSAQTGLQKPINAGAIDPYKMRQNQLSSNLGLE